MTLLRQPGGRKMANQKKVTRNFLRFCPTRSSWSVGPELWQEVWPTEVGGLTHHWPTNGSVRRMAERQFGARCPSAIRDFSPPLGPPTKSRQISRARTTPSGDRGQLAKRVTSIGTSREKNHLFETPTGCTVPEILVARMGRRSESRGQNGRPKFPRFRPILPTRVGFSGWTGTLAGSLADLGRRSD
jgi:hypothetical protein